MRRRGSLGATTGLPRTLCSVVALCLAVGLLLSGIACWPSPSGLSPHAARIQADLEAGRLSRALAAALTTVSAEKVQVAGIVSSWAYSAIKAQRTSPLQGAEALVVALKLDPALEMAYRELANLLKNNPDADVDQAKSRAAYESWNRGEQFRPRAS